MEDIRIPKEIPKEIPKPRLRVFLIRHGEVDQAAEGRLNGHQDVALSPKGEQQMAEAAEALGQRPVKAVFTSDLYRARRGAELTAQKLGIQVQADRAFREIDFGEMAGLGWREVMARLGAKRMINWVDERFPGGENLADLKNRVMPVYKKIVETHSGEIAIFAHGGANRLIIFEELGISLNNFFSLEQSYGCVNVLDYYAAGMKILRLMNGSCACLKNFEPV